MEGKQGWWVVFGSFLALAITAGVGFFSMPVMLGSIIEDTGWSLKEISIGVTIWSLAAAVYSPLCGAMIERFGARRVMMFGTGLGACLTFLTGRVNSLNQFYAIMLISSVAGMSNTYMPVATVVSRWFVRRRGIATGIAMLGLGAGGATLSFIVGRLLAEHTWREIYPILAGILLLSWIPILIWIRDPDPEEEEAYTAEKGEGIDESRDLDLRAALRTRSFWGLSMGDTLTGFIFAIINFHLVYYLTADLENEKTATNVYSVLQICLALGTLVFGPLADRFSIRRVMFVCYLLPALATILLLPGEAAVLAFLFAIVGGMAGGGRSALFPVALVRCFGETHMAVIWGISNSFFMVGNALGPWVGGAVYERTENTQVIYIIWIVVMIVSAFLVSLIRGERPASPAEA